jgi:hypothetical protein
MFASYYQLRLCRLAWYLLALLPCWSAAQQTFPAGEVAEVDLIFPRNDTYAPTLLTPIVFAIQNSKLAAPLNLNFAWGVQPWPLTNNTLLKETGFINTIFDNFTSSDPYFEYNFYINVNATEGIWQLTWAVYAGHCNASGAESVVYNNSLIFTTKNGAQLPDFVAATADGTCESMESVAFNVTEILPIADANTNRGSCAVFVSTSPALTPSPCGAKVNALTALSISAGITSMACGELLPSVAARLSCSSTSEPTPTSTSTPKKNDGVRRGDALVGGMVWTMATLNSLSYIISL